MKFFLPLLVAMMAGYSNGVPHLNFATFRLCGTPNDLQTLWPDWNNNRIFYQCMAIDTWGVHDCPGELLFSFDKQVCVWEWDWVAPPPQDVITPRPTTLVPTRGPTVTQEVTVPVGTTTTQEATVPTLPEITTTTPPTTTTPTTTTPTTTPPTTPPPVEDPGTTTPAPEPPTPEATTPKDPTPPTPGPTEPGETRPPPEENPNEFPPTPAPTNIPDDVDRPSTPEPTTAII